MVSDTEHTVAVIAGTLIVVTAIILTILMALGII